LDAFITVPARNKAKGAEAELGGAEGDAKLGGAEADAKLGGADAESELGDGEAESELGDAEADAKLGGAKAEPGLGCAEEGLGGTQAEARRRGRFKDVFFSCRKFPAGKFGHDCQVGTVV
jgi:hypothetical protein